MPQCRGFLEFHSRRPSVNPTRLGTKFTILHKFGFNFGNDCRLDAVIVLQHSERDKTLGVSGGEKKS